MSGYDWRDAHAYRQEVVRRLRRSRGESEVSESDAWIDPEPSSQKLSYDTVIGVPLLAEEEFRYTLFYPGEPKFEMEILKQCDAYFFKNPSPKIVAHEFQIILETEGIESRLEHPGGSRVTVEFARPWDFADITSRSKSYKTLMNAFIKLATLHNGGPLNLKPQ